MSARPNRPPVVLSPLAEGADRLVAEVVLEHPGAGLSAVLPLPQDDYEQDFGTPESVQDFRRLLARASEVVVLPPVAERNEAYANVGEYVLNHCEVLVAIWDGQPAQGRGGTAEVVQEALARGLPVLHVLAGNRKPGTHEPTSLGVLQGNLVVHNLP
jgi:hypothetical protein